MEGKEAYAQFGRELMNYLQDNGTIQKKVSPRAYQYYAGNQMIEDGFRVLTDIVTKASPQHGGEFRDLNDLVKSLTINNGEMIVDYYLRVLQVQNEIKLQNRKIQ